MSYKPGELFVGVVDFFAVLLPGAVMAAVAWPQLGKLGFAGVALGSLKVGTPQGWIAFGVAAYLLGSVLFLIGAFLDGLLYDPFRRLLVPPDSDDTYDHVTAVRGRVLPTHDGAILNNYQWARATLRLRSATAMAEVERYEADSKFFRSLATGAYVLFLVAVGAAAKRGDIASMSALAVAIAFPVWLIGTMIVRETGARRARARVKQLEANAHKAETKGNLELAKQNAAEAQRVRAEAKVAAQKDAVWHLCVALPVFAVAVLLVVMRHEWQQLGVAVAFGLFFWRYGEQRWKSTQSAYNYAIILYDQEPPREPKAGRATPSAGASRLSSPTAPAGAG